MSELKPKKRALFIASPQGRLAALGDGIAPALLDEWDIRIERDPARVLDVLSREPTHAVVAERGVAGVDGGQLLDQVRTTFPEMARLLVDDAPNASRSIPPKIVQWLPHPAVALGSAMPPASLAQVLQRTYALHRILTSETVQRVVGHVEHLPSVPRTYTALLEASSRPDVSIADLAHILEQDPSMSVRVLHLVNSAFFGLARRTTSISQAVSYLGVELLKGLVLTAQLGGAFEQTNPKALSLDMFQAYSIRVARLAKRFAEGTEFAVDAFTAGIVHDIGKVVLAVRQPLACVEIATRVAQTDEAHFAVERDVLGVTHAEAGAYLLATWGIPFSIVECVAFHHEPSVIEAPRGLVGIIHAADVLTGINTCGEPGERLDTAYLERVGFGPKLEAWRRIAEEDGAR